MALRWTGRKAPLLKMVLGHGWSRGGNFDLQPDCGSDGRPAPRPEPLAAAEGAGDTEAPAPGPARRLGAEVAHGMLPHQEPTMVWGHQPPWVQRPVPLREVVRFQPIRSTMNIQEELLRFYDRHVVKCLNDRGDADHAPLMGNLYSFLAFQDFGEASGLLQGKDPRKMAPMLKRGLQIVIALQIVGPPFVMLWALHQLHTRSTMTHPREWTWSEFDPSIDHFSKLLMGYLFLSLFCINGIYVIESDKATIKRIIHLEYVFRAVADKDPSYPPTTEWWLYFGACINCWCLAVCAIALVPLFAVAEEGVKDVTYDALALTFLYNLDDLSGDLGFLEDQWDEDLLGSIYGHLADEEDIMSTIRREREGHFTSDNIYAIGGGLMHILVFVLPIAYLVVDLFRTEVEQDGGRGGELQALRESVAQLQAEVAALAARPAAVR